jgi:hypothetical protein
MREPAGQWHFIRMRINRCSLTKQYGLPRSAFAFPGFRRLRDEESRRSEKRRTVDQAEAVRFWNPTSAPGWNQVARHLSAAKGARRG